MTDTVSSGATARTQSDDRTLAFVVYAMHFVSPFVFGLTSLIGVAIAGHGDNSGASATAYVAQPRLENR